MITPCPFCDLVGDEFEAPDQQAFIRHVQVAHPLVDIPTLDDDTLVEVTLRHGYILCMATPLQRIQMDAPQARMLIAQLQARLDFLDRDHDMQAEMIAMHLRDQREGDGGTPP